MRVAVDDYDELMVKFFEKLRECYSNLDFYSEMKLKFD